jgi:hypothetical protein
MISNVGRIKHLIVFTALALALVVAGAAPLLGGQSVDAAKSKKAKAPNIALQSITLQPHPDPGHMYVVVEVENVGNRDAAGFRIGMSAQRADMTVRPEEFSLPLTVAKGGSTTVQFRLGCDWINGGAITARTDPSPVPGESPTKTANNVITVSGLTCS